MEKKEYQRPLIDQVLVIARPEMLAGSKEFQEDTTNTPIFDDGEEGGSRRGGWFDDDD